MGDGEMPSETIYGAPGAHVRVAWGSNRSGEVQVASLATSQERAGEATDRLLGIVNDWLKAADMPVIDVAELRKRLPFEPDFDGWHASLTEWAEVNRLIKVLKRARDQSFGSPE